MKSKLAIDTKVETYETCGNKMYIRITEKSLYNDVDFTVCLSPSSAKKLNKFLDKYLKALENEEK